ncbi:sugar nucleotide-binding protein [Micromonospora sp. WMMD998]|uniref:SDR family oxidoreductase n=1 Tax=Micromonospora sp. WMMD998 TaxID=3016092 RepID=UPI00249C7F7C|nr:sugar nucleotide-binding protein [Micromonospora sp. WMMD998]WFE41135.1 sugar nucleotide-binding protein [Micromonospora sp. WMMD998]
MRVLVVGSGLIGARIGAALLAARCSPVLASRHEPAGRHPGSLPWIRLDATDRAQCAAAVRAVEPDAVVLVHGPSDVTWCEEHPESALRDHVAAAENLTAVGRDVGVLLISTDNVFDGTAPTYDESAAPMAANAYGRAKLRAEETVRSRAPGATVLRVSLVYGWEPVEPAKWYNFFAACVRRLRAGRMVEAPADLWNTPVVADDVALVACALVRDPVGGLVHLGGPDRISRADWASLIARELGADPGLVVPVPRARTRYASRPRNSCLTSTVLGRHPTLRHIRLRGVVETARAFLADERRAPW